MKNASGIVLLGVILMVTPCHGKTIASQGPADTAAQPVTAQGQPTSPTGVLLKEGTEVHLALAQEITGRAAVVGDPVELVLAEDLRVGDAVVVRKGARVLGTVVEGKPSENKRVQPKSLRIRVDFLRIGNSKIPLRGEQSAVGKRGKNAMLTGSAAMGVAGLLLTMGKKYQLPAGTPVIAYVDQDVELSPLN